jgi:hypothetical protein
VSTEAICVSLCLNNYPRISVTRVKSRIEKIRRFKQEDSLCLCKMAGARFDSITEVPRSNFLTLSWQTAVLFPRMATKKVVILRIASGRQVKLDSELLQA